MATREDAWPEVAKNEQLHVRIAKSAFRFADKLQHKKLGNTDGPNASGNISFRPVAVRGLDWASAEEEREEQMQEKAKMNKANR